MIFFFSSYEITFCQEKLKQMHPQSYSCDIASPKREDLKLKLHGRIQILLEEIKGLFVCASLRRRSSFLQLLVLFIYFFSKK